MPCFDRDNAMKKKRNLKSDPLMPFPAPNPKSRPVHKAAVLALKQRNEQDRLHPEPMSLMHKREKNSSLDIPPRKGMATIGQIMKAAKAAAEWDNADPFAYGRMALHVSQGFVNSTDIVEEMTQRTAKRKTAKRREIDNAKSND